MAAQIRSNISAILLLIRDRIVSWPVVPLERILVTAEDDPPFFNGEQVVVIQVLGEQAVSPNNVAAGRINNERKRTLRIHARTRQVVDPADQDAVHLTDVQVGHLEFEDTITDALETFQPTDNNGNQLVAWPLWLGSWSDPKRHKDQPEWMVSRAECVVAYNRALNLNYL